mmetsp:Transcript_26677/g.67052  ORF Transcript_26677/g.67052 Transcript_26677/m.67052 type:complete len:441 (-) Transcript_26677:117-1439(-)|eukprot:CAMPEP_0177652910 /NCGR_PEP_ID=MMETSP0447-20121125/13422_1 /TAXON_ID=0 /ORGANISM="Stygamoeba regulata, Strain BSH-02190019" /LENGTH=440 /DNA_ID=CAMNT_0019156267 /DNA_START=162 /DNA_END=1484 /DNA_ORIENTATION=-
MSDEDYDFDYSEENQEEDDLEIQIQNTYFTSKGLLETDADEALAGLQKVVQMELDQTGKGDWGFRALKQIVKLHFFKGRFQEMMATYREMLTYIKSAVTRNFSEKVINSVLETVSTTANLPVLEDFYDATLKSLAEASNERLWFRTNFKLGKLHFERQDYSRLSKILKVLHKSCQRDDGTDDHKKGTQLLEVYALAIQMYTETKNTKKLEELYTKSLTIKSAIPHPRIIGVIRECGGKMHITKGQWSAAYVDFFEAFKNYDEAGSPRRINCLRYLVLSSMMTESNINPFYSTEAKPYAGDPQVVAMTDLVTAYQKNDIHEFERVLEHNRESVMDDPFIRGHVEDLLKNIRTQVLTVMLRPYTCIGIPYISTILNIPPADVEELLVRLILDGRIDGRIDQVAQQLHLDSTQAATDSLCVGMAKWTAHLAGCISSVHATMHC